MNRTFVQVFERISELVLGTAQNLGRPSAYRPVAAVYPRGLPALEDFYALPNGAAHLTAALERQMPDGARSIRFTFPSPIPSSYPQNNAVVGLADLHPAGAARGALILLHGHKMAGLAAMRWFTQPAFNAGFDVYIPALPYHAARRPRGTYAGQLSISADLGGTLHAFQQAVVEARALAAWISAASGLPVTLGGISLGGYVAALAACVHPGLAGVVPIITGASFACLVSDDYSLRYVRRDLAAAGVTPDDLEAAWALLAPGRWRPLLPPERILLVAGEHDPSVLPANTRALAYAWGDAPIRWHPVGHATLFLTPRPIAADLTDFLQANAV